MVGSTQSGDLLKERYRLLDVVGEGGMAVVWRAEDELLGRAVAVKILREQYASDPDFLSRLRTEARSAAALNDPGVVGVFDVGEDDGRHFIVMEFVDGRNLKDIIRSEGALQPDRAVSIGANISRAVGVAHVAGMVHRDVKPQNVLVGGDGRVKVADFGIARAMSEVGSTAPGIVLGTVHYIAPEVAAGGAAGPTSDVYSLGVVLYEMLSGQLPFDADSSWGVATKIMNDEPEPLEAVNPRVPTALARVVRRAMSRAPNERYSDAGELADDLDEFAKWSAQATAAVPPVGRTALAGAGAGVPVAGSAASSRAAAGGDESQGPLLDRTGLILAVIALIALAGLIPLWRAVGERVRAADIPIGSVESSGNDAVAAVAPSPEPTATIPPVPVPNVVLMDQQQAQDAVRDQGLSYTVSVESSSDVPAGRVISQVPPAGRMVLPEQVVELIVSGTAPVVVPPVEGDWFTASSIIEQVGLVPRRRAQWGVATGQVVSTDPPAGTKLPAGAPVDITVGSGNWLPLGVDFDDNIHLSGIDVATSEVNPGQPFSFAATWEATDTSLVDGEAPQARANYAVRARLLDDDGSAIVADTHVPVGGSRPTHGWQPGEVIQGDVFTLPIDPAVAPGEYLLVMDMHGVDDPQDVLDIVMSSFARTYGDGVQVLRLTVLGDEAETQLP